LKLVDPLGLEPRPDGLRDRCAAITPRVNGKGGGSCIPIIGFGGRGSAVELRPFEIGTSLMNRTSVVAVRSRNAGSTGRGVVLWRPSHGIQPGLLSLTRRAPSHLARRTHSSHACAIPQAADECQPRHRRPACAYAYLPPVASCCCYPVVKELRTRRRCAGRKNKKARMLARSGPWAV
jgi:hypothetical protein